MEHAEHTVSADQRQSRLARRDVTFSNERLSQMVEDRIRSVDSFTVHAARLSLWVGIASQCSLRIRKLIRKRVFERLCPAIGDQSFRRTGMRDLKFAWPVRSGLDGNNQRRHLRGRPGISKSNDRRPQTVQVRARRHRSPACWLNRLDLERFFTAGHDQSSPL